MAGHNKWTQIKHRKNIVDQKRGQLFSKLLNAISIAAKSDVNPNFNPRLKTAVQKAKNFSVPNENIDRAIKRASEENQNLEELLLEAYGPGGAPILIEAITDNRNRTVAEVKKIIGDNKGKWANPGSVLWTFDKNEDGNDPEWRPKFNHELREGDRLDLEKLVTAIEKHSDIQSVFSNPNLTVTK
ncbi:MAG: DNA-binding regulatory protein, YebC/PmpR family [Parcubacteria group bacterium Gr01-1014_20]|nr:MAG: DNA-binding regulatory protein, YebC/PmpR family [Parcubacteria group bacterium Gr01-1014_20]